MLRSFGLPGTINGAERMKLVSRDENNKEILDAKGNIQYVTQPRFLIVTKDEKGEPLMATIIRRDHEGKIIPGTTEIEINMRMNPVTRQAEPGSGQKVLAQVVKVPTSKSIPNPAYYEPKKDDKGNVIGHVGYDFTTHGVRKLSIPENYRPQTEAPYLTQADARVLAAQKKTEQLEGQISEQNLKIDQLIELVKSQANPVAVAPVVVEKTSEDVTEITDDQITEAIKKTPGLFDRIKNVLN